MIQVYKNLYKDEETGKYIFADDNDTKLVVSQESYLLAYLLEVLMSFKKEEEE